MPSAPERLFSSEEKTHALDLILRSQTFARAEQLKRFLRYVCEMEDAGRADEITEYSIGTAALGRPRNYSPAADSGVRGRAHDLRQKLDQFYEIENPGATLRIGLRRGSYTPYFYEIEAGEARRTVEIESPAPSANVRSRTRVWIWIVAGQVMTLLIAILVTRALLLHHSGLDPVFQEFWGSMASPDADVLLCLGTPPSLLVKPFLQRPRQEIFEPLPDNMMRWRSTLGLSGIGQPYVYPSTEAPLFGDAEAAVFAAQTISKAGGFVDIVPENTLRPSALRTRDVMVIGGPNYSVYVARVLKNTPFTISEDRTSGEEVIVDRRATGKSSRLFVPERDDAGQLVVVYGLITVFPNQTVSDRSARMVIVSGVTGAGAAAAMHFFTSSSRLHALRTCFRKDGLKAVPSCYQIVVRGTRDRAVPLSWELATYRVMEHPPIWDLPQ